jgi:hypothetical protein
MERHAAVGMEDNLGRVEEHADSDATTMMMADSTPPTLGAADDYNEGDDDNPNQRRGGDSGAGTHESTAHGVVAYLSVRKQPPLHVFSNEPFEVEFSIEAARGSSDSPPTNVSVQASLLEEAAGTDTGGELVLSVLEDPRISASRRTGKVRCRVRLVQPPHHAATMSPSMQMPRSFAIRLSTKESIVSEVTTRKVHVVAAKLKVIADPWNPIWYKDEGGRDKCMEVHVQVYDARDEPLSDLSGPLQLTLCYDEKSNYMTVINQELFRSLGTKQSSALENGRARVRFRIEDVSKNHQGQDFSLKVAVANAPSIAPGYTPSVSVRSKRNKRQRVSMSGGGGGGSAEGSSTSQPVPSGVGLSRAAGGSQLQASSSSRPAYDHPNYPSPRMMLEGTSPNEQDAMIRGAIQGVAQWADDVVNSLYSLQWQVLGYAQTVDGSPDYSRPYHNMPNPNQHISRMLSQYSETIHGQLRLLEEVAVQGALLGGATAASSSGAGGMDHSGGAAVGAAPPHSRESPYPSHMLLPQQDPYGTMMMPQQQRPGGAGHASSSYMQPPTPVPLQHSHQHHPSQQPHQAIPMRTGAASSGIPPNLMDVYRDYNALPPPGTPGDYYGRMHPSPPMPPMGVPMHHHPHYPYPMGGGAAAAAASGTAAAASRYDDPDPIAAQLSRPPSKQKQHHQQHHPFGSPVTAAASSSSRRDALADDDDNDEASGAEDDNNDLVDSNASRPSGGAAPAADSRRGRDDSEDDVDDVDDDDEEEECVESNVEYILAKQYKSLRTGNHLGFPAFSASRRLLGFYRDKSSGSAKAASAVSGTLGAGIAASSAGGGGARDPSSSSSQPRGFKFVPLSRTAVDRGEIVRQASAVLQRAMETRSEALHALKDWGSIVSMVDHALVYDWSKDVPSSSSSRRSGGAAMTAAGGGASSAARGPGSRPSS